MNSADLIRLLKRAQNLERQAKNNDSYDQWIEAAELYRQAKDEASAERCEMEADKCQWSA